MQTLKSVFGVIGALVPVLYWGGLFYYFFDVSGSWHDAQEIGLAPTLLGLAAVGLLFCIPLILKIVRLFVGLRSPGSGGRGGSDASTSDGGFDADAVLARYMAGRSAQAAPDSPAAPPADEGGGPTGRPSFGRRIR
jgi:hypothetical protein